MIFNLNRAVLKEVTLVLYLLLPLSARLEAAEKNAEGYTRLSVDQISVYYQVPDEKVARLYLQRGADFTPRPEWQRQFPLTRLEIYIAPSEAEFQRLSGGLLPEWGLACALPERDLVIVRSPRLVPVLEADPEEVLLHEISHVFLDQRLRPAAIPRWFHEGYALYCSRMWGTENFFEFSIAVLLGRARPFAALTSTFPGSAAAAHLAYLQSYTVVEYIFSRWDREQLSLLFTRWREQGELDRGLRLSLGLTLGQLENEWRQWVEVRYGWLKLITSVTMIWLLAAGLFVAVYISRRLKFKKGLTEMKKREALRYDWPVLEAADVPDEETEMRQAEIEGGQEQDEKKE